MRVAELIAKLQQEDPKATVHFSHPSKDYWHTTLAPEVMDVEGSGTVTHSQYYDEWELVDPGEEERPVQEPEQDQQRREGVVVLSA